jgi:hypothetical protein
MHQFLGLWPFVRTCPRFVFISSFIAPPFHYQTAHPIIQLLKDLDGQRLILHRMTSFLLCDHGALDKLWVSVLGSHT